MFDVLVTLWLLPQSPGVGCTMEHPEPTTINSICTGIGFPGTSCKVNNRGCSPIPGKPGTWNPDGYTPKGWWDEEG